MNSFNLLAARVTPSSSPGPTRTNSLGSLGLAVAPEGSRSERDGASSDWSPAPLGADEQQPQTDAKGEEAPLLQDEQSNCLAADYVTMGESKEAGERSRSWRLIPKKAATTLINSLRWVLSTLVSPGVYLIAWFYDENGNFAPLLQLKKLFGFKSSPSKLAADVHLDPNFDEKTSLLASANNPRRKSGAASAMSSVAISSAISESESDAELMSQKVPRSSETRRRHSKSSLDSEEISPARRSIRIKLHNDEALRQRRQRKSQAATAQSNSSGEAATPDIAVQLKSPTSPVGALTKYPRTPAPPRPLIPRRQPSYLNFEPPMPNHQKTLILDLDETLIHSMSKGGRMSTGHMVEVRLTTTTSAQDGPRQPVPLHPILYYVHKRPHCDDFLRRVCKWYNLVIFTASVQEYADPVIDWLEQERKYFTARYYRQHCTFRQGAFIKDLSSVEPDLSKVMILDNSPLSYLFNQDNAIPIHGWTNDPTDKHLMHLVPMLEGLQYVTDVRAFLALRGGEDGQHMA